MKINKGISKLRQQANIGINLYYEKWQKWTGIYVYQYGIMFNLLLWQIYLEIEY